jgi:hypothetical protein
MSVQQSFGDYIHPKLPGIPVNIFGICSVTRRNHPPRLDLQTYKIMVLAGVAMCRPRERELTV